MIESTEPNQVILDYTVLKEMQQVAPLTEITTWKNKHCTLINGIYMSPDNKPVLPKLLYRYAAVLTHGVTHVSSGGMVAMLNKVCTTYGFTNYSKKLLFTMYNMCQEQSTRRDKTLER